jgi:FkbM family methyltransferase
MFSALARMRQSIRDLLAMPSGFEATRADVSDLRLQLAATNAGIQSSLAEKAMQTDVLEHASVLGQILERQEQLMHIAERLETRLAAAPQESSAQYAQLLEELRTGTIQWRAQLAAVEARLATLARSAPGRGNIALPGGRLLLRISLPELFPHGDPILFVNADDKLIVPKLAMTGYYELESSHFLARSIKPQDHAFDVGANFGYYTMMMGILVGWKGKVVAFEPHPGLITLLRENKLINWVDPWVDIVAGACMEKAGETLTLHASGARLANTSLTPIELADGFENDFKFHAFEAKTVRIDDSLASVDGKVDFMKIDIEGAEPFALRGARETIAANPQIRIMMEWSPGQLQTLGIDLHDFARELEGFGLSLFSLYRGGPPGATTLMDFADLPALDYQNIVLMRAET